VVQNISKNAKHLQYIKVETADLGKTVCLFPNTVLLNFTSLYLIFAAIPCAKGAEKCKDALLCVFDWTYCDLYKDCKDESDEDPDMCRGIIYVILTYSVVCNAYHGMK